MNVEKRSPWVVLGIPFPASKAEANRAFARRSRSLRKSSDLPWAQEDLSWALAQITLAEENPESTIEHFRVPADPGVFERPDADDLFVPAPQPIARRTQPAAPDALDGACAAFCRRCTARIPERTRGRPGRRSVRAALGCPKKGESDMRKRIDNELAGIRSGLELIKTVVMIREPATGLAAEAYDGLRRQVIAGAAERNCHLQQLARLDAEVTRGASIEALQKLLRDLLAEAGLHRMNEVEVGFEGDFDDLGGKGDTLAGRRTGLLRGHRTRAGSGRAHGKG